MKEKMLFTDFIYDYMADCHKSRPYKAALYNVAHHLEGYAAKDNLLIYTDSMSEQVFENFVFYLQEKQKLMASTVKNIVGKTKYLIGKAARRGYPVDSSYEDFNVKDEEINTIFLTKEEIMQAFEYTGLSPALDRIKDRFIIGCVSAMRYSDYSRLGPEYFIDDKIKIKTKKTNTPVHIPIHPLIKLILKKYDNVLPPPCTIQHFNRAVKKIFRQIGFTELLPWERKVGGKPVSELRPKYRFISSHTARRTAATNMYLSGIPVFRIMLITGYKTEASFFRYICITRDENAQVLAQHPYFNTNEV